MTEKIDLPIIEYQNEIIKNLRDHPIILITGPTGCGKVRI